MNSGGEGGSTKKTETVVEATLETPADDGIVVVADAYEAVHADTARE